MRKKTSCTRGIQLEQVMAAGNTNRQSPIVTKRRARRHTTIVAQAVGPEQNAFGSCRRNATVCYRRRSLLIQLRPSTGTFILHSNLGVPPNPITRSRHSTFFTLRAAIGSLVPARPCAVRRQRAVAGAATRVPYRPAGGATVRTIRTSYFPPVAAADRPGQHNATINLAKKALEYLPTLTFSSVSES